MFVVAALADVVALAVVAALTDVVALAVVVADIQKRICFNETTQDKVPRINSCQVPSSHGNPQVLGLVLEVSYRAIIEKL